MLFASRYAVVPIIEIIVVGGIVEGRSRVRRQRQRTVQLQRSSEVTVFPQVVDEIVVVLDIGA